MLHPEQKSKISICKCAIPFQQSAVLPPLIRVLSTYYCDLCILAACASCNLWSAQLCSVQPDGIPVVALWGSLQWKY